MKNFTQQHHSATSNLILISIPTTRKTAGNDFWGFSVDNFFKHLGRARLRRVLAKSERAHLNKKPNKNRPSEIVAEKKHFVLSLVLCRKPISPKREKGSKFTAFWREA